MPHDVMPDRTQRTAGPLSNKELLLKAADIIAANPRATGKSMDRLECVSLADVRAMSTSGTVLEPIIGALVHDVEIPNRVGGMMDALALSKDEIHALSCNCLGADVDNMTIAMRLREVAAKR